MASHLKWWFNLQRWGLSPAMAPWAEGWTTTRSRGSTITSQTWRYTRYNSHLGVVTPDFFGCFPPNSNICSQTSSDLKAPSDPLSDKWFVVVSCLCFVHWSIGWLDDLCDIFFFLCACLWHSWTMPIIDSIARLKPMFSGWEPPPGLGMRCLAVIRSSCGRNARVEHLESYVVAICYSIRCHHMSS